MALTVVLARPAQRDVVKHDAVISHHSRFPDHDASTVVKEEPLPDARSGVDFDAGPKPVEDGEDPRQQAETEARMEPMGQSVQKDCVEGRMAEQHFGPAVGCRIIPLHGSNVLKDHLEHRSSS